MLSKNELEYLKNPSSFNANYSKVLRHRINSKTRALTEEISLLTTAGLITRNCNQVTEFSNPNQNLNQVVSMNQGRCGASGGIWTRDHYLTKVTPHRTRLRRQTNFSLKQTCDMQ